jgi:hypothetical protein
MSKESRTFDLDENSELASILVTSIGTDKQKDKETS